MSDYYTWHKYPPPPRAEQNTNTQKACYDPEEGPKVWQRMTKLAKGQPNIPKFLSTHPQNQDRQERLRSHMEEVPMSLIPYPLFLPTPPHGPYPVCGMMSQTVFCVLVENGVTLVR